MATWQLGKTGIGGIAIVLSLPALETIAVTLKLKGSMDRIDMVTLHWLGQYWHEFGQYWHGLGLYWHGLGQYWHGLGQYWHGLGQLVLAWAWAVLAWLAMAWLALAWAVLGDIIELIW